MTARRLVATALVVLALSTSRARSQEPSLGELAQRAWDANLAAYERGEVTLSAAYRFSQEVSRADLEGSAATFDERLTALHALAEGQPEPVRAIDLQTIVCVRALISLDAASEPAAQGTAAVAAIGSLLASQRQQLMAGAGDPEEFYRWSDQLRSLECRLATTPAERVASDRAHERRQAWLSETLQIQYRGPCARFYELAASPPSGPRTNDLTWAGQSGFEVVWSAFLAGGTDVLAVETWSLRQCHPGLVTPEQLKEFARGHLARMRRLEEAARKRPEGARAQVESALLARWAAQQVR